MPLKVGVVQTGLEKSVNDAIKKVGKNLKINMGPGTKSVEGLVQPLGRLTGKADDFTKSMSAANARVLAFGASVGVIAAVTKGFKDLVSTTIQVEKSLANINSILNQNTAQLESLKGTLFDVAKNTESTFDSVAGAALELSRQGLEAEQITKRLSDAMILSRLSGLSAADAVSGLTAAINSFSKSGITSAEVLNKISAAAASAAVSDRDLIEGLKRSGSVAVSTGVEFDQLIGIIAALQQKTARGGAVIGNSLKTIFTRISDVGKLKTLQDMGVQVTDLKGDVLSANKVIENLAPIFAKLDQTSKVNLADNLVGKFQIAPFLSLLEQYNEEVVVSNKVATISLNATGEAYERNKLLNETLSASINKTVVSLKELSEKLGKIGVTDSFKNLLDFFGGMAEKISGILDGDGIGSKLAKGLVKGISAIVTGPGLLLLAAIIAKISKDFIAFGFNSLKTFFGINKAAKEQAVLQGQIAQALLNDSSLRKEILRVENSSLSVEQKRKVQADALTGAYNAQLNVMRQMQSIAATITPSVMRGTKAARTGRAAGGFLPVGAEKSDISRGVGGAPASAKPVVIPNFAFGGGKRGTMVANSSEYIVPNYANGGDAIFNQNMASSMGLPANARKVRAASGYIPNYVDYSIGGRRFSGAGVGAGLSKGTITPQQAADAGYKTSAQKKAEASKKTTKTTLNVPARIFGVASLFKGKKTADSATSPGQLTSPLATKLAQAGVKNIKFNGIQIKSLEDFKRNAKVTEKSNRTQLAKIFAGPLVKYAQGIIGKTFGNDELAAMTKEISRLGKSGGSGGARLFSASVEGGILESAMTLATKGAKGIKDFKSNSEDQIPFDFEERGLASSQFKKTFGFTNKLQKADAKRTASNDAVRTIIKKAFNDKGSQQYIRRIAKGQGFKASEGYIPNFAEGALENAIGREKAAGLPVSQIRINQSGKLRNSQNPMGLAVTNTRDEPTGAIPAAKGFIPNYFNFGATNVNKLPSSGYTPPTPTASTPTASTPTAPGSQKDLTGIFFAVSAGMTALKGATDGASGGMAKFTNTLSGALQTATGFAFAGAGISQAFAGATSGIGKLASKLGPLGVAAGVAVGGFQLLKGIADEMSGKNARIAQESDNVSRALASLADSSDILSGSFELLSKVQQFDLRKSSESILGRKGFVLGKGGDERVVTTGSGSNYSEVKVSRYKLTQKDIDKNPELYGKVINDQGQEEIRRKAKRTFEGDEEAQKELKEQFLFVIDRMRAMGVSAESVDDKLDKFGRVLEGDELVKLFKEAEGIAASQKRERGDIAKNLEGKSLQELERERSDFEVGKGQFAPVFGPQPVGQLSDEERLKVYDLAIEKAKKLEEAEITRARNVSAAIKREILEIKSKAKLNDFFLKKRKKDFDSMQKFAGQELKLLEKTNISDRERAKQSAIIALNKKLELKRVQDTNAAVNDLATSLSKVETENLLPDGVTTQEAKDQLLGISTVLGTIANEEGGEKKLERLNKLLSAEDINVEAVREEINELNKSLKDLKVPELNLGSALSGIISPLLGFTTNIASAKEGRKQEGEEGQQSIDDEDDIKKTGLSKGELEFKNTQALAGRRARRTAGINRLTSEEVNIQSQMSSLSQPRLFSGQVDSTMREASIADLAARKETLDLERKLKLAQDERFKATRDFAINKFKNSDKQGAEDTLNAIRDAKDVAAIRNNIDDDHLAILDNQLSAMGNQTSELELQLELARGKKTQAQLEADLIKEKGVFGAGFITGFNNSIQDANDSTNTLGNTLGSASAQFAHNIGSAMLESIKQAEDLGDLLIGVAVTFLDTISQAFMTKAVNNIVGTFGVGKQGGGPISGGSGTKDDVPAMLMGGEFVMNKKAVKKYGPAFMSSLNNGSIQGFSEGGKVLGKLRRERDPVGPQAMPGFQGAGAIKGMRNLMAFATQTNDPGMENMTMFGRRNSRVQNKYQDAKRQAFDLALGEMAAHKQAEEEEKAHKKALMKSLKGAVISSVVSAGVSSMASGFKAGFKGTEGSTMAKIGGGFKGSIFGGNEFDGKSFGGLKNLFTGRGFETGPGKAQIIQNADGSKPSKPKNMFSSAFGGLKSMGSSAFDGLKSMGSSLDRGLKSLNPFGSSGNDFGNDFGNAGGTLLPRQGIFDYPFPVSRATGGLIPPAGGVDTVPAMLSGGEFVMNSAATQRIGSDNLAAANAGGSSTGGDSTELVAKIDELITVTQESGKAGDINITINGSTGQEQSEGGEDSHEKQRELSEKIKVVVKQVITDEQRLGGQLRK